MACIQAVLTTAALEEMWESAPHWVAHEAALRGAVGSTVWGLEIAGAANDIAERRVARYGGFACEARMTAAPLRELGLTG